MEALIPVPTDCEVRSMIKFLNAQSIALIVIHRELCQVYGHTQLDGQYISCRSSAGRCLIISHPIARTLHPVISIFSYTSRNSCPVTVFRITEWWKWVPQWFQSQAADFYDTGYKSWSYGMINVSVSEINMLKNSSTLAVSVPTNLSVKLDFVSVKDPRETYFLDKLRASIRNRCIGIPKGVHVGLSIEKLVTFSIFFLSHN